MSLWGIYIPRFDQISVKISVLGVLYPNRCTDGVTTFKLWVFLHILGTAEARLFKYGTQDGYIKS